MRGKVSEYSPRPVVISCFPLNKLYLPGACDVYVGEYSCTLSNQTWSRIPATMRPTLTRQFGQAQSKRWLQLACGSAFWTMNMDWMPGGDWGFQEQVDKQNIVAPLNLTLPAAEVTKRSKTAEVVRDACMAEAVREHQSYWESQAPEKRFEHWRFADGVSLA